MMEHPARRQHGEGAMHTKCGGTAEILVHPNLARYYRIRRARLREVVNE